MVTGAAGFVGGALTRRLLAAGDHVRAVVLPGDRLAAELRALPGASQLELVEADIRDGPALREAFAGAQRVFHTAAMVHAWAPRESFRSVNVEGSRIVAEAVLECRVGRLVAVSTTDVFGIPEGDEVLSEASPYQMWGEPYPDTKIEAEQLLWRLHRDRGLPLTVVYPGWVYGPGDRAFFPGIAEAVAGGSMILWFRDLPLAWAFIENLVDACLLASSAPLALGQGYIVHDGLDGPTLDEVCARIAYTIGARRPRLRLPAPVVLAAAAAAQAAWRLLRLSGSPPLRTVDVKAFGRPFRLANDKARSQLGWNPRVGHREGMDCAFDYLREHRGGGRAPSVPG